MGTTAEIMSSTGKVPASSIWIISRKFSGKGVACAHDVEFLLDKELRLIGHRLFGVTDINDPARISDTLNSGDKGFGPSDRLNDNLRTKLVSECAQRQIRDPASLS